MASIGTPAAIRPMTGTETAAPASSSLLAAGLRTGSAALLPRLPSITLGANFLEGASPGAIDSGNRSTSSARARLGSRRMNPRSSSAVMRRWMPDFDARSKASFISSKDGGMPASFKRSWMNINSSCCLRVSIATPGIRYKTKPEQTLSVPFVFCNCLNFNESYKETEIGCRHGP